MDIQSSVFGAVEYPGWNEESERHGDNQVDGPSISRWLLMLANTRHEEYRNYRPALERVDFMDGERQIRRSCFNWNYRGLTSAVDIDLGRITLSNLLQAPSNPLPWSADDID